MNELLERIREDLRMVREELLSLKFLAILMVVPLFIVVFVISVYTSRMVMLNMLTYDPATEAKIKVINERTAQIDERLTQINKKLDGIKHD